MFVCTLGVATLNTNAATPHGCQPNTTVPCYVKIGLRHDDWVINYDNTSTELKRHNADWPATLFFWNNAEVDKIKRKLDWCCPGGREHMLLRDSPNNRAWDQDGGTKTGVPECGVPGVEGVPRAKHVRLYADSNDHLYNSYWGYMVVGTTHIDIHEGCGNEKFGLSERAEHFVADWLDPKDCCAQSPDYKWWTNKEEKRREGNHVWKNDGRTTYIGVR
jgi:hypothetical protein